MDRIVVIAALILSAGPAAAQTVDGNLWTTDGNVLTVVRDGNTVYLGGQFTQVGPSAPGGAPVSLTTGALVQPFPRVEGVVDAAVPDGANGWFIGGHFNVVGGLPRSNLAHILADGSVAAWSPDADDAVRALALSGSVLYVGGAFGSVGGQDRSEIGAVDVTTGAATAWDPGADSYVDALAVSGSTVYAGGEFTTIAGQTRNHIAALDASSGAATAWDPDAEGVIGRDVLAIAVSGNTVYVGGSFETIGGLNRAHIAGIDATSGAPTSWHPTMDGDVHVLTVSGSKLYVGGAFTTISEADRNGIAAVDLPAGTVASWDPDAGSGGVVDAIAAAGSTVYVGGSFASIGGQPRRYVAALDATTGAATAWNPNPFGLFPTIHALAPSATAIYVGGTFSGLAAQVRNHVAALDATTGAATAWDPNANGDVYALLVSGGTVYATGLFTNIGGQTRNYVAALDNVSGAATGWNPNANYAAYSLAVSGSTVYVGGDFSQIGGQTRNFIAGLDASTGAATAFNPDGNNFVRALAVNGSTVYAGGQFSNIGGQSRQFLAALDATTGAATSWNPITDGTINALVLSGNTLYAAGIFTLMGGQPRNRIAALDAATGLATSWDPNADGTVVALALSGSTIYAGGAFTTIGGQIRQRIAGLSTATGAATSWNPFADDAVDALATNGVTVYAGGVFSEMNEVAHPRIAAIGALAIASIYPARGGNGGLVTVSIAGASIQAGATIKLTRAGQSPITAMQVAVASGGESVSALFDLSAKPMGSWSVVITNPNAQAATLTDAFTIEQEEAPVLRVDVIGPSVVRSNRLTAFDVVIENQGNSDAVDVPLWITGIPSAATLQLGFTLTPAPSWAGEPDWSQAPLTFSSGGGRYLAVVIPRIPPGAIVRRLSVASPVGFQLGAAVAPAWASGAKFRACLMGGGVISAGTCVGVQLNAINAYLSATAGIEALSGIGAWAKVAWECEGAASLPAAVTKAEQIMDFMVGPLEGGGVLAGCEDQLPARWRSVLPVTIVSSVDPNAKLGPSGPISGRQAIAYSIRFENLETATAPAQRVGVSDPLDGSKMDLNSVSLGTITFGSTRLDLPPGLTGYATQVDLRPAKNLIVRVNAGLDPYAGRVTWYFSSIDPATGQPPQDPLAGFLSPNQVPPQGEGSVLFTVMPRPGVPSGSSIQNQASITFDDDDPLATALWSNTLDNTPPSSQVLPLASPVDSVDFTVRWGPVDSPDVRDYTVYVAEDNGPLRPWRINTPATADTFASRGAHQYVFYISARDMIGNIETAHASAGATTIGPAAVSKSGDAFTLSLAGAWPNPARGAIHAWFTLPNREPATLELIDIAGRRVVRREVGAMGPGRHVVDLAGRARLRPGLFLLRLAQGRRVLTARVALIQ